VERLCSCLFLPSNERLPPVGERVYYCWGIQRASTCRRLVPFGLCRTSWRGVGRDRYAVWHCNLSHFHAQQCWLAFGRHAEVEHTRKGHSTRLSAPRFNAQPRRHRSLTVDGMAPHKEAKCKQSYLIVCNKYSLAHTHRVACLGAKKETRKGKRKLEAPGHGPLPLGAREAGGSLEMSVKVGISLGAFLSG
jgi:hypothetical protein